MSIIQHLNQNVTTQLTSMLPTEINIDSLLEQYYAVFSTHLADASVLTKFITSKLPPNFEEFWDANHREIIIQELSDTHHIHVDTIAELISITTPIVYQNIQQFASSEIMPVAECLKENSKEMRMYLPAWAGLVISDRVLNLQSSNNTSMTSSSNTALSNQKPFNKELANKTSSVNPHNYPVDPTHNYPTHNASNVDKNPSTNHVNNDSVNGHLNNELNRTNNTFIDRGDINQSNGDLKISEGEDDLQSLQASLSSSSDTTEYPSAKSSSMNSVFKIVLPIFALGAIGAGCWFWVNEQGIQLPFLQTGSNEALVSLSKVPVEPTVKPAVIRITSNANGGLFACYGNIGNGTLQSQVIKNTHDQFGDVANSCIFNIVGGQAGYKNNLPSLAVLPDILPIIQSVPFASVEFTGNEIKLNAPDKNLLETLVTDTELLAPKFKVSTKTIEVNHVEKSIYHARNALSVLSPSSTPQAVAQALSLAEFEFDEDGGQEPKVSQNSQEILDEAANLLKKSPDMLLLIMVHTNNTVSANTASLRASTIKQYLISKGVTDVQLIIKGLADQYPIADNETALGRVLNNRVEFLGYSLNALAGNPINDFGHYQGITTLTNRYQAGGLNQQQTESNHVNQSNQNSETAQTVFHIENGKIIEGNSSPSYNANIQNSNNSYNSNINQPMHDDRRGLSPGQLLAEEANRQNNYGQPQGSRRTEQYSGAAPENNFQAQRDFQPMIEQPVEESQEVYISSYPPEDDFQEKPSIDVDTDGLAELEELADVTIVAEPVNGGTMVDSDF